MRISDWSSDVCSSDLAEFTHRRPHPAEQHLARLGQRHRTRGPLQQPHTDPLLEAAHQLPECGRRNADRLGGAAEAEQFTNRDEGAQMVVVATGAQAVHEMRHASCRASSRLYGYISEVPEPFQKT